MTLYSDGKSVISPDSLLLSPTTHNKAPITEEIKKTDKNKNKKHFFWLVRFLKAVLKKKKKKDICPHPKASRQTPFPACLWDSGPIAPRGREAEGQPGPPLLGAPGPDPKGRKHCLFRQHHS